MLLPNFQLRGSSSLTCYFAPHFSVSSSSLPTLTRHPAPPASHANQAPVAALQPTHCFLSHNWSREIRFLHGWNSSFGP